MSTITYDQPFEVIGQYLSHAKFVVDPDNPLQILVEDADTSALRATALFAANATGHVIALHLAATDGTALFDATGIDLTQTEVAKLFNDLSVGLLAAYADTITPIDDDTLVQGSAGIDHLETGAGNDTVFAGNGDDHIYKWAPGNLVVNGGLGNDTLFFQTQVGDAYVNPFTQRMVVNLFTGKGFNPYGGTLTLTGVENVVGTSAADRINGNNQANIIGDGFADGGADTITAMGGDDVVKVLDLAHTHADGGDGFDTFEFLGNIDLQDAGFAARVTNFEKFAIFNFYILPAGSTLRGDAAANWFVCDDGLDTLEGRGGNDTLNGGKALKNDFSPGADVAVYSGLRSDYKITVQGGTLTITDLRPGSPDGTDTVVNIETLRFHDKDVSVSVLAPNFGEGFFGTAGNDALGPDFGTVKDTSVYGLAGDDTLSDGAGNDLMVGGTGNDTYILSAGTDRIIELSGEGIDTVDLAFQSVLRVFSLAGLANIENLTGEDYHDLTLTGNALNNVIQSFNGADTLRGGDGNDTLIAAFGKDRLFGGAGDDRLDGGYAILDRGADTMTGGSGRDVFVFNSVADSTPLATDIITDFHQVEHDRIGLAPIDPVPGGTNGAFHFIGGAAFTALGQVRVVNDGVNTFVEANATGDLGADLRIQLNGVIGLTAGDFYL